MANLFAFRATEPADMFAASDPIGPGVVVVAWGNGGAYLGRSNEVTLLISDLHCLKINMTGEPAHPLYLKGSLRPIPLSI